jgi:hypothetical protein
VPKLLLPKLSLPKAMLIAAAMLCGAGPAAADAMAAVAPVGLVGSWANNCRQSPPAPHYFRIAAA